MQWHLPPKGRVLWNKDEVVVGSGDSKAAETQTGQGHSLRRALLTKQLSQAHISMKENAKVHAACTSKIQEPNAVRQGLEV